MNRVVDLDDLHFTDKEREYNTPLIAHDISKKGVWHISIVLCATENKNVIQFRKWFHNVDTDEWSTKSRYTLNSKSQVEGTIQALQDMVEHI